MAIVGGLDVHRNQVTFDHLDLTTGQVSRASSHLRTDSRVVGTILPLPQREGDFALEATTGWRFVVEGLERAGFRPHLAEPADTRALRGPKRRAKNDRLCARTHDDRWGRPR